MIDSFITLIAFTLSKASTRLFGLEILRRLGTLTAKFKLIDDSYLLLLLESYVKSFIKCDMSILKSIKALLRHTYETDPSGFKFVAELCRPGGDIAIPDQTLEDIHDLIVSHSSFLPKLFGESTTSGNGKPVNPNKGDEAEDTTEPQGLFKLS